MGKVKDKLREYYRSKNFLDTLCKAYFDATAPKWCSYSDWRFSCEHEDSIMIHYSYIENDKWVGNHMYVKFDELIKKSKKLL